MLGDTPDIEQKAFLQKRFPNIVFLESDWEILHVRVWLNSVVPGMVNSTVCPNTVFAYCDEFGLEKIETLEFIKHVNMEANSVKRS